MRITESLKILKSKKLGAFTMFELLLAMAIIGILASLSVPLYWRMRLKLISCLAPAIIITVRKNCLAFTSWLAVPYLCCWLLFFPM